MIFSTMPEPRKLRILMIHGYAQSGPMFQEKMRTMERRLRKTLMVESPDYNGIEFYYPTAPFRLIPPTISKGEGDSNGPKTSNDQIEAYTWATWESKSAVKWFDTSAPVQGLETSLNLIAKAIHEHGPFDGAIAFSSGAALLGAVTSLLEIGRSQNVSDFNAHGLSTFTYPESFLTKEGNCIQAPLSFSISCSGCGMLNEKYNALYAPLIKTASLHFIGTWDTMISEQESLALAGVYENKMIIRHPGAHALPNMQYAFTMVRFIIEACEKVRDPVVVHLTYEESDQSTYGNSSTSGDSSGFVRRSLKRRRMRYRWGY